MTGYFGRRYHLSASHRLFCPEWDDQRNAEIFGKCANPHGHGHNYTVEMLVGGAVDSQTGMVIDMVTLDRLVSREVLEAFDHTDLNKHDAFEGRVPTSENFCIEIFERLLKGLPAGVLRHVQVEETPNNFFTYFGKQPALGGKGKAG